MNEANLKRLEYDKIKEILIDYTVSPGGRRLAEKHLPSTREAVVRTWLNETEEAAGLLASGASIPLSAMEGIEAFVGLLGKGKIYVEQELSQLSSWLAAVAQMKRYMNAKRQIAPLISGYADSMNDCPELRGEIDRCIRHGVLTDHASAALADIRRHMAAMEDKIERKLNQILSKYKNALQEQLVSKRNGHFVIPVKRELRRQVPGTVRDESASGQTLFVEPADVAGLQAELQMLKAEEEQERTKLLSEMSRQAEEQASKLKWNLEAMASLDFIFARAKLSRTWDGKVPDILPQPVIKLVQAKHPLLGENGVPLNVSVGRQWRQLMITGPNTGGKTITLKTIGLLALMVQSGLLVPAGEGTAFGIFRHVLADVGDGQSIEQSLSTFSAHMACLKEMLDAADDRSLLLLDELAAGTDPGEGIALSIAVLEELLERGSLVAATTHFNEIKRFAAVTPGCTNARMAFDPETLRPLYRLEIGEAGDSYAFAIARRFGLPDRVVASAETRVISFRQSVSTAGLNSGGDAADGAAVKKAADTAAGTADKTANTAGGAGAEVKAGTAAAGGAGAEVKTGTAAADNAAAPAHGAAIETGGADSAKEPFSGTPEPETYEPKENWQEEHLSEETDRRPAEKEKQRPAAKPKLQVGDCVWIHPLKRTGVVYQPVNERGEVVVQVQRSKMMFNHKRLALYIPGGKLYPGRDYDMDIVFESKEKRKAKNLLKRKHVEGLEIITPADEIEGNGK